MLMCIVCIVNVFTSCAGAASMPGIPAPPVQAVPEENDTAPQKPAMKAVAPYMLHPDPRTCQVLMHLGTLQLPFKVGQQAGSTFRMTLSHGL